VKKPEEGGWKEKKLETHKKTNKQKTETEIDKERS